MNTSLTSQPSLLHEASAALRDLLPPPANETPEERAAREQLAAKAVIALRPADAFEFKLAAQIVAANDHAMDCFRVAVEPGQAPDIASRHRAQACAMMRQMLATLRSLQHLRAAHEQPAQHPIPLSPAAAAPPSPTPTLTRHDLSRLSEADRYAVQFPDRAARIRAAGGLPPQLDFPPPRRALVKQLLRGDTPILRRLDALTEPVAA